MISRSPNSCRPSGWLILCFALVVVGLAGSALADTIYLKNGRVIRTERARIEGDRVVFVQFGAEVQIPLSIVDRVEQDEQEGPEPLPAPAPGVEEPQPTEPAEDEEAGQEGEARPGEQIEVGEEEPEVLPEETRAYWQERVLSILRERADLEEQLQELRREERAFLFSHRSTADTRRQIEEVQQRQRELDQAMAELQREARRLGIPPGWLRVDASEIEGPQD